MLATLLVPGLNCSARVFAAQIPALWQAGPVTVADHRQGDSITAIAESILAAAPPRFALAGFSLGGYIALEMLRLAPQRVDRLALLATNARPDEPEQRAKREQRIAVVEAGGFENDLVAQFPNAVHPDHATDKRLFENYRATALDAGPEVFVRHTRAIIERRDQRALLPTVRGPALVVAGDNDQLMPPALTDELAAAIPDARLVTIAACGHYLPLEQPERLTAALLDWLAR